MKLLLDKLYTKSHSINQPHACLFFGNPFETYILTKVLISVLRLFENKKNRRLNVIRAPPKQKTASAPVTTTEAVQTLTEILASSVSLNREMVIPCFRD